MLPPEEVLVPSDNFTITFHRYVSGKEQVSLVDPQYLPRRHGEAWGRVLWWGTSWLHGDWGQGPIALNLHGSAGALCPC